MTPVSSQSRTTLQSALQLRHSCWHTHSHTLAQTHTLLHWQFMSFLIENLNLKRHGKAFICAVVNVTGTGTGAGLALPPYPSLPSL